MARAPIDVELKAGGSGADPKPVGPDGERADAAYGPEPEGAPFDILAADWAAAAGRRRQPVDLSASQAEGAKPGTRSVAPAWKQRQRWLQVTRVWALVKMASLAYTTWWAMGAIHAHTGETIAGFGAACLFSAVGARWRRRYFGPGQLLEPELYEALGIWLYRVGTVLVIGGAALAAVAPRY